MEDKNHLHKAGKEITTECRQNITSTVMVERATSVILHDKHTRLVVSKESKELFGLQLKKLRKQVNISQEEFAYRVGMSVMTVGRWERGEYGPEFDHLDMIAQALGVRIRDLFDFGENKI